MDKQLACSSLIALSQLTQPVRCTYTCWNMHVWILFYPVVPRHNRSSNHTALFDTTYCISPLPQMLALPHPHAMSHMINRSTMEKERNPLSAYTAEFLDTVQVPVCHH